MAKRSFQAATYTPTATGDASAFTATTYQALESGGPSYALNVIEIECGGQATTSAVNIMQFARMLVVGTTPTALTSPNSDGPLNSFTQSLPTVPLSYVAAATNPQRATDPARSKLNLSFNAFGGIIRWQAAPYEEWGILGNAVNVSGSILGAFTGGNVGLMGSHIIYEPL